ncbi:hypothetical protein MPSEU_000127200 [Mayamaea pseudoterrestris]|nr:hypothetical protein MPSEU_000127200 [Mayamaea pseudoterrestris]
MQCIAFEATKMARAFPGRDRSSWCLAPNLIPVRKNSILRQGLILTKVPKAASSTSAGVALRITDRNRCHPAQWEHRLGSFYSSRLYDKSFLFTSIRAPDERAISSIFYHKFSVNRPGPDTLPTDQNILRELRGHAKGSFSDHTGTLSPGQGGFTLQYASLTSIPDHSAWDETQPDIVKYPEQVLANVKRVVDDYDMLLVVDRMDESLVVLSLLLGVDVGDVVVADSKITGETYRMWKNKPIENSVCIPTKKSFKSDAVASFLESDQWRASNYGDYVLHAAAHKSLELTIEQIGREKFEATLTEYKRLKTIANDRCAHQIHLPCGPEGQLQLDKNKQSCYILAKDFGCAHGCIDAVLDKERPIKRDYNFIDVQGELSEFKASLYAR